MLGGEATGYATRRWLSPEAIAEIEYAMYWNDEAAEREKEWWVIGAGGFTRMEEHLVASGLQIELEEALAVAQIGGIGADLAAGTLWAIPSLLAAGAEHVYAVEFSAHRLLKLGPAVLRHYNVPADQVDLCLGSFYDVRLPDGALDFVLLAQALHHADRPLELLTEVRRLLRPGGVAVVIGEHDQLRPAGLRGRAGWAARALFRRAAVDPLLGDHLYTAGQYRRMFRSFEWEQIKPGGYLLRRP